MSEFSDFNSFDSMVHEELADVESRGDAALADKRKADLARADERERELNDIFKWIERPDVSGPHTERSDDGTSN